MNKYERWYQRIIEKAKDRVLDGYKENHHIVPRSLGGTDSPDNLVLLTAREHFICHWLLTKIYTGDAKSKMIYALNGMKRHNRFNERYESAITARVYDRMKAEFAKVHSQTMKGRPSNNKGRSVTEEQRLKNSLANKGKKRSADAIARTVAKQLGSRRSQETKDKISAALKGRTKSPMSDSLRMQISNKMLGVPKSDDMRNKLSATIAAQLAAGTHYTQQPKMTCPHCGTQASKSRFSGFHGDKCKKKAI